MQTCVLPFMMNTAAPEKEFQPFSAMGTAGDAGFEAIMQGALGVSGTSCSGTQVQEGELQGILPDYKQTAAQVAAIIEKLTDALQDGAWPEGGMHAADFLENVLTDGELAFLVNVLKNTALQDGAGEKELAAMLAEELHNNHSGTMEKLGQAVETLLLKLNEPGGPAAVSRTATAESGLAETIAAVPDSPVGPGVTDMTGEQNDGRVTGLAAVLKDVLMQLRTVLQGTGDERFQQCKGVEGRLQGPEVSGTAAGTDDRPSEVPGGQLVSDDQVPRELAAEMQRAVSDFLSQGRNARVSGTQTPVYSTSTGEGVSAVADPQAGGEQAAFSTAKQSLNQLLSSTIQANQCQQPEELFMKELQQVQSFPLKAGMVQSGVTRQKVSTQQTDSTAVKELLSARITALENGGEPTGAVQSGESADASRIILKEPLRPAVLVEQVAVKISTGLKQGQTRMILQIHPPELGKLDVGLSVKNNQLQAMIIAETAQVKHMLEANLDQLRGCLESQNIEIEKFSVHVGNENRQQFASLFREQKERSWKGAAAAGIKAGAGDPSVPTGDQPPALRMTDMKSDTLDLFA